MTALAPSATGTAVPAGFVARADALALSVGARMTVSTLMLGCVLTIALGAASMLDTLKDMDRSMKEMNGLLVESNKGTRVLNVYMDSVPKTDASMKRIVASVEGTSGSVATSKNALGTLAGQTAQMETALSDIAGSTGRMRGSLEQTNSATATMAATVTQLNGKIGPLVRTQGQMLERTKQMQKGLCGMNSSLAYTLRTLNYLTAPPHGGPFTVRVELDKKSLPPIPGVKAEAAPVQVFERGVWPIYNERGPAYAC